MSLIGDPISPQKMYEWGIVNVVVQPEELIPTAMEWARKICANSPDSVIASRTGMLMSLECEFSNVPKISCRRWESRAGDAAS